jgi:hypothetical protein
MSAAAISTLVRGAARGEALGGSFVLRAHGGLWNHVSTDLHVAKVYGVAIDFDEGPQSAFVWKRK